MQTLNSQCDAGRLRRLLNDELSSAEQLDVTSHVESCEHCQQQLEQFAAGPDWWAETREFLVETQLDPHRAEDTASARGDAAHVDADEHPQRADLAILSPSDNPAMLGRLGEFDVLEVIGRGGMGVVFKGYDHELNRWVAIKALGPQYAGNAAARKRFAREAQAAAAVVHPHVVAIHAVNATHQPPFFVMSYVPGESLQQRLDRVGQLTVEETLRIGQQIADGLAAAHAQGLVHRDIKPANILLERNVERVLISDFGLARAVDDASMTQSGIVAGTPQFMSPEQTHSTSIDHRSDIFSLGTVLYTLLAGHSPFRAESALGVLRRVADDTPRPLREVNEAVPDWLEAFIAKLHAKAPDDRVETASEVAALLKGCLAHVQQPRLFEIPDEVFDLVAPQRPAYGKWLAATLVLSIALVLGILASVPKTDSTSGEPSTVLAPQTEPVSQSPTAPHGVDQDWDDPLKPETDHIHQRLIQLEAEPDF